jgi:hypothetical protein
MPEPASEPVSLSIPLERLGYIIAKAREYEAETAPVDEDSGSNPTDDEARSILEASADNPTREELVDAVNGLNDEERIELLALAWLGRGDFAPGEWAEALAEAGRSHDRREAEYLASTPLLAAYLEEGLALLGYAPEDTENSGRP